MAFVFEMPEVGEGVVEAEVVDWKVAVGDVVEVDQPLCEIITDKATLEIPSPRAGVVLKLHAESGDTVEVHTPLVEIDTSGAAAAAPATPAVASTPAASTPAPKPTTSGAAAGRPSSTPPRPQAEASVPSERSSTKATPSVRRRAREDGVDIHRVAGTGPKGRVTHADVAAHQAPVAADAALPLSPVALPQVRPSGLEERVKIIGLRRRIAQQMVAAKQTAPHFTYVEEIDCKRLVELRTRMKPRAAAMGVKLTYLPIIAKACSVAFREFPNVNAVMDESSFELVVKSDHNIGFACDSPNGLFVPVIKNVEQKSILHIAAEMAELSAKTRAGQASREDLTGGTFTMTSVGAIGGVLATPILNVPEVAILGVNRIRERAVVINGQVEARPMMYLSPSFDHRIIDGAVGARFVALLKHLLEEPEALLLELV